MCPTTAGNLVLLCRADHHRVHYHGWNLTLHPDATTTYHLTLPAWVDT